MWKEWGVSVEWLRQGENWLRLSLGKGRWPKKCLYLTRSMIDCELHVFLWSQVGLEIGPRTFLVNIEKQK